MFYTEFYTKEDDDRERALLAESDQKYNDSVRKYEDEYPDVMDGVDYTIRLVNNRKQAWKYKAVGVRYTTLEMIKARWSMWGDKCWICGKRAVATDHVKPLSKGGAHLPCNLRPICTRCNSSKNDTWPYPLAMPGASQLAGGH